MVTRTWSWLAQSKKIWMRGFQCRQSPSFYGLMGEWWESNTGWGSDSANSFSSVTTHSHIYWCLPHLLCMRIPCCYFSLRHRGSWVTPPSNHQHTLLHMHALQWNCYKQIPHSPAVKNRKSASRTGQAMIQAMIQIHSYPHNLHASYSDYTQTSNLT